MAISWISGLMMVVAGMALGVANGVPDSTHTYVVKISVQDGHALCSGTFLNPNTLLTAGHCAAAFEESHSLRSDGGISLQGIKPVHIYYFDDYFPELQDGGAQESSPDFFGPNDLFGLPSSHQGFDEHRARNDRHDLVLAVFPEGTGDRLGFSRDGYPSLALHHMKENDGVIFVGFGMQDLGDHSTAGVRRTGTNEVLGLKDDTYYVRGLSAPDRTIIGARIAETRDNHVQITDVYEGSPAEKAGLREGDIVLSVNGTAISSGEELVAGLQSTLKNAILEVIVYQTGKKTSVNIPIPEHIKPGENADVLPGDSGGPLLNASSDIVGVASRIGVNRGEKSHMGLFVDALSPDNLSLYKQAVYCPEAGRCARYFRGSRVPSPFDLGASFEANADGKGVTLSNVLSGGALAKAGLGNGDTLLEVNGVHVKNADDVVFGLDMPDAKTTIRAKTVNGQEGELTVAPTAVKP